MLNSTSLQNYRIFIVYFLDMKWMPIHEYWSRKSETDLVAHTRWKSDDRYFLPNYISISILNMLRHCSRKVHVFTSDMLPRLYFRSLLFVIVFMLFLKKKYPFLRETTAIMKLLNFQVLYDILKLAVDIAWKNVIHVEELLSWQ